MSLEIRIWLIDLARWIALIILIVPPVLGSIKIWKKRRGCLSFPWWMWTNWLIPFIGPMLVLIWDMRDYKSDNADRIRKVIGGSTQIPKKG